MEVSEDTANELERIAEENDVELDELQQNFQTNYEEVEEKSNLPENRLETIALRVTRTDLLADNRVPTEAIQMLTIGGDIRNWSSGDTFVGRALVDQNPEEDQGRKMISSVIISEDDVSLSDVQDAFSQVGNIVSGEFSVSDADLDGHLMVNSSEDSELDVTVPGDETREELVAEIRDEVPEFTIENISDNLSATEIVEDDDTGERFERAIDFGVDIRRIEADIYDSYKNPDEGNGNYTIRDETVFDEEDVVASDVHDDDAETRTPGLTAWTDPSLMEYGTGTVAEFFGTVTTDDKGIPQMNVDGIYPLYETEFDGYDASQGSQDQKETSVDKTEI